MSGRPYDGQGERHGDHRNGERDGQAPRSAAGGQRPRGQPPRTQAHEQRQQQIRRDVEDRDEGPVVGVDEGVGGVGREVGDEGDRRPGEDERDQRQPEERPAPAKQHDRADDRQGEQGGEPLVLEQRRRSPELGGGAAQARVAAGDVLTAHDDPPEVGPGAGVAPVHEGPAVGRQRQVQVRQQPHDEQPGAHRELAPCRPQATLDDEGVEDEHGEEDDERVVGGEPEPQDQADGVEEPCAPARRRGARPEQGEQHEERDEGRVEAVDLGDDRLAPGRLGGGRQQTGGHRRAAGEPQSRAAQRRQPGRLAGRGLRDGA